MILLSARRDELEVLCDDDRRSHLGSTRSHCGLHRHRLFLLNEAHPSFLESLFWDLPMISSTQFCCATANGNMKMFTLFFLTLILLSHWVSEYGLLTRLIFTAPQYLQPMRTPELQPPRRFNSRRIRAAGDPVDSDPGARVRLTWILTLDGARAREGLGRVTTPGSRRSCPRWAAALHPERWPFSPALPVAWAHSRVGEDSHLRTTWRPHTLTGSTALLPCVTLEVFATPTRRYHGRTLIRPSPPACATSRKSARTHASSGPSRVTRRLLATWLGDSISLALQMSGRSDFGILSSFGASSIIAYVSADTASAACPEHPGSLVILSMTFAAVICDADDPCSVNTACAPESSFTISPPLYFWCLRTHFSWLRFGTSYKSGIQEASYWNSLHEKQKLQSMLANQDYTGSLQKTKWRNSTPGREIWCFDCSRSRSPHWKMWVSTKSSIQRSGTRFSHSMDTVVPVQNRKLLSRRKGVYDSFSSHLKSQKSFTLSIRWNLVNPVNIYHGIIVLLHLIDLRRMGLPKEHCAEKRKEHLPNCCNLAWTKNGGLMLRNAVALSEIFKISWQTGKHLMEDDSENHSKVRWFRSEQWLNIIRFLRKNNQASINLVRKSYQGYSKHAHWLRSESGKEILWLQELGKSDASEVHARRLNAKEVLSSKKGWKIIFPFADGTSKLCGRDHEVRESTLRQYHPVGSVDLREEFQGNSDVSQPTEAHDHAEARNDFCGCRNSHDGSVHFPFEKCRHGFLPSRRTRSSWRAKYVRLSSVSLCRRSWSRRGWLCSLTRTRPVV